MKTLDQVKKVAKLANLSLSDQDLPHYSKQMSEIVDYIDLLEKVDVSGVEPTFNIRDIQNVMIKDVIGQSLSQEQVLSNSANTKNGYFVTKGVFEEQ